MTSRDELRRRWLNENVLRTNAVDVKPCHKASPLEKKLARRIHFQRERLKQLEHMVEAKTWWHKYTRPRWMNYVRMLLRENQELKTKVHDLQGRVERLAAQDLQRRIHSRCHDKLTTQVF